MLDGLTVVVIVRHKKGQSLGIVVDARTEVYQLSAEQIKSVPYYMEINEQFVAGIASVNREHAVLIQLTNCLILMRYIKLRSRRWLARIKIMFR
ncbi:chemotaxis protein CheW [Candidatus Enterovibrio altilux]|nr:chemotaxis protein CheW [Candidatus Enterovibrio luxaltus]